jgi:hypothetical protein
MAWLGLFICCLVASALVNWQVKSLIWALPLSCLAGPLVFLFIGSLLGKDSDALDGLVLIIGQVAAIPAAVIAAACFRSHHQRAAA